MTPYDLLAAHDELEARDAHRHDQRQRPRRERRAAALRRAADERVDGWLLVVTLSERIDSSSYRSSL